MSLTFEVSPDEIEAFLQDADEQLAVLDRAIVELEARSGDEVLLQAIFRAAHTLKGNAGLIRHQRMAALTHALETAFDKLRRGQVAVTPELIDAILASVDGLRALKGELLTHEESAFDVDAAVRLLQSSAENRQALAGTAAAAPPLLITPEAARRLAARGSATAYRVAASVDASSIAPAARIYQVHAALGELAEVLATAPPADEIDMGSAAMRYEAVILTTRDAEELRRALLVIPEVAEVRIALEPAPSAAQHREPSTGEAAPSAGSAGAEPETRVRIGTDRLDRLMNLTGELVVSRTHLLQIEGDLAARQGGQAVGDLTQVTIQLGRIIDQLHEEVMRARMVPVASLFVKFPRLVRDVSRRLNKTVNLVIEGEETELDRSVVEGIGDPIVHLLRNAIDHGLEPPEERRRAGKPEAGTVLLSARQQEGHILIAVSDDGRGIDPDRMRRSAVEKGQLSAEAAAALSDAEAIELIFRPGMSTKQEVTDLSGRGVGMDIVRANIERLNGAVEVHTVVGSGTTFELTLPLTLAIIPAMLVTAAGNVYAVPLSSVVEVQGLGTLAVHRLDGGEVIRLRDQVLPLLRLRELFGLDEAAGANGRGEGSTRLVVVRWGRVEAGLVVDELIGNRQVVCKSLGPLLTGLRGVAGGSILGSGRIALILDVPDLIKLAMRR